MGRRVERAVVTIHRAVVICLACKSVILNLHTPHSMPVNDAQCPGNPLHPTEVTRWTEERAEPQPDA